MCHRKQYVVPSRMHYDIYETYDRSKPIFICSCAKEDAALDVLDGLVAKGLTNITYKVRARPTVEHTIHSRRV